MRKELLYVIIVLAAALLIAGFATAAAPANKGNPFDAVWAAIDDLQNQINGIQPGSVVKIVSGSAYNDDIVPLPAGYTGDQCTMAVYPEETIIYNINANNNPAYQQISYITDSIPQGSAGFLIVNKERIVWVADGQTYAPYPMPANYLMICTT
jgi:hypothetical protein